MRAHPYAAVAAAVAGVLMLLPSVRLGWIAALPAAVAVSAVVCLLAARTQSRTALTVLVGGPALVSLGTTSVAMATGYRGDPELGTWGMVEVGALLILVGWGVRWGEGRLAWAAVGAAACAQAAWILRFIPDRRFGALAGGAALWAIGSVVAAGAGGYPRLAERRLRRVVVRERAQQRRQLERDLHDYVAHDLTGILVQSQAAQYAAKDDAETLVGILSRIEAAASRAVSAMDRSLELLRDGGAEARLRPTGGQPTLSDLPSAVAAFEEGTRASVTASFCDLEDVPHEVSAALHRIGIEALTNIRRHAPEARAVGVTVSRDRAAGAVALSVTNAGAPEPARPTTPLSPGRASGTGLAEAAARVEALGGTFTAGPAGTGWSVTASLPVGPPSDLRLDGQPREF